MDVRSAYLDNMLHDEDIAIVSHSRLTGIYIAFSSKTDTNRITAAPSNKSACPRCEASTSYSISARRAHTFPDQNSKSRAAATCKSTTWFCCRAMYIDVFGY